MVSVSPLKVRVWRHQSGASWAQVGELSAWESLSIEPRYVQAGPWSLQLPYTEQTAKLTKQHLLTFDFRGRREMTGLVEHLGPASDENGRTTLELAGTDALSLLDDALCWPVPTAPLSGQTSAYYTVTGPTETALHTMIRDQYGRLYNGGLFEAIPGPASERGPVVTLTSRFGPVMRSVVNRTATANLGIRLGLVTRADSSTRADLTVSFYDTRDVSTRVRLSHKVGTLRSWSQSDDVPTGTRAIVAGGGQGTARVFRSRVSDPAEADWGRRREIFTDSRGTSVTTELDDAGDADLAEAAAQSSFSLEATDAEGMRYGTHFHLGDSVSIELLTGLTRVDRLGAVTITSDDSGAPAVQLVPGNPDAANPLFAQAAIVRALKRQLRDLQQEA